jgi:hypothetical protein
VITPQIRASFDRIASGLDRRSGQRAWRINADYGLGKSSFALFLAHLLSGQSAALPKEDRKRGLELLNVQYDGMLQGGKVATVESPIRSRPFEESGPLRRTILRASFPLNPMRKPGCSGR